MKRNPFTDSEAIWAIGFLLIAAGMIAGVIGLFVLLISSTV